MTNLSLLLLIAFFFEASAHATRPLVSLQMTAMGSTPGEIGLLFAAANVVPLFLGMPLGRLADRFGPARLLAIGAASASVSYVGMALAPTPLILALWQTLMWTGISAAVVAEQVMIAVLVSPQHREQSYGWLGTVHAMGQLAGPAFGGLLADAAGINLVFLSSAVPSAFSLLVLRRLSRAPEARAASTPPVPALPPRPGFSGLHLFAVPQLRFTFLVAFLIIVAYDVRHSFLPLHLSAAGFSKSGIGAMFSILAAAAILIRPLVGWLTLRMGNWRLLAAAIALAIPALLLFPLARHPGWIAAAMTAIGISFGLTQPLTMSLTAEAASPGVRGVALGMRMSAQRLSMLVSPLVMGALAANLGLWATFVGAGVFEVIALGAALHGVRQAKRSFLSTPKPRPVRETPHIPQE